MFHRGTAVNFRRKTTQQTPWEFPNGSTELALSGAQAEHPGRDQEEFFSLKPGGRGKGDASDLG